MDPATLVADPATFRVALLNSGAFPGRWSGSLAAHAKGVAGIYGL